MLENKKAVIFDLDGSLVDSMWIWPEVDVQYMDKYLSLIHICPSLAPLNTALGEMSMRAKRITIPIPARLCFIRVTPCRSAR